MTKRNSSASTENVVAFDQVNARSGHDWMKGEESSADYFARARAEAVRSARSAKARGADSDAPSPLEKLRRAFSGLFRASK
ncbi:hypothetical protein B6E66_13930 [Streptomyces maremycinicus]|nr:hypothetical protein B6E66_13930 [Streptomyces sp. B9173]